MSKDRPNAEVYQHEIDCVCGETSVGKSRPHAEVLHLTHFLNEHSIDQQEEELAREQLDRAEGEWGGFDE